MESESTPLKRDDSRSDDLSSDDDSDIETATIQAEAQQVEWLATGRQRRSTAGNRMKSMLANEEPDSDLELLFAEDENDQGFTDVDADGSDVHMDSSSDDEDETNAADDLEGEKELEKQAKEKRRKRRAQDAIPAKFRKKVRIDPTRPTAPAPRPKKKSERTSWLPSAADLPTRASSRSTTRLSKEQLHQQMIEREERRLKQLDQMAKKAAKLEAMKKPPMTQEERLREAATVEKRNSKSLNRWEVAEKQREEERRAKLAALNNRTLKGPVITFWSGLRESTDGVSTHMGMMVVEEKPQKKVKRVRDKSKGKPGDAKDAVEEIKPAVANSISVTPKPGLQQPSQLQPAPPQLKSTESPAPSTENAVPTPAKVDELPKRPVDANPKIEPLQPPIPAEQPLMAMPPPPPPPSQPPSGLAAPTPSSTEPPRAGLTPPSGMTRPPEGKPSGVLAAPALAPPPSISINGGPPPPAFGSRSSKSTVLALPDTAQLSGPPIMNGVKAPERNIAVAPNQDPKTSNPPSLSIPTSTTTPIIPQPPKDSPIQPIINTPVALIKAGSATPSEPLSEPPSEAPPAEILTCNAIIFQNFNENAIKDRNIQTQILFNRKMTRLAKPSAAPLCVITNHPARYRDPKTGLPYYNAYAYREIQRLRKGDYRWSRILGAWVGSGTYAARGVPERFLHPEKESPNKKRLEEERKKKLEEEEKKKNEDEVKKLEEEEREKKEAEQGKKDEEPKRVEAEKLDAEMPDAATSEVPKREGVNSEGVNSEVVTTNTAPAEPEEPQPQPGAAATAAIP